MGWATNKLIKKWWIWHNFTSNCQTSSPPRKRPASSKWSSRIEDLIGIFFTGKIVTDETLENIPNCKIIVLNKSNMPGKKIYKTSISIYWINEIQNKDGWNFQYTFSWDFTSATVLESRPRRLSFRALASSTGEIFGLDGLKKENDIFLP